MFCGQLSPNHIKNDVSVGDHAASVRRHLSEDSYKDTEVSQRSYEEACMDQGSDVALNTIHAKTQGSCLSSIIQRLNEGDETSQTRHDAVFRPLCSPR